LAEADHGWEGDDEGDEELAAAAAVWGSCCGAIWVEEHAEGDEEVSEDFGVGGEDIGKEDIAEFAVFVGGNAADGDTLEGGEEAVAAGLGETLEGQEEEDCEEEEVGYGEPVPGYDEGGDMVCEGPEDEEGDAQGDREECCEAVGRVVVG